MNCAIILLYIFQLNMIGLLSYWRQRRPDDDTYSLCCCVTIYYFCRSRFSFLLVREAQNSR